MSGKLLVFLLLVAVGCGSGSGPASQGEAKPTASATAAPAGTTPGASATPLPLLGSVKSADGAARVDVPVGSLPAGMRVEDIKITAVDPASLPVKFPDGPALAAYKLEPDGTKFPKPVMLSVTLPSKEAFLPSVVMVSGDEVSPTLEMDVAFDAKAETLTVSTKLDHFSTWTVAQGALFTVFIENISDQIVGTANWFRVNAGVAVTAASFQGVLTKEVVPESSDRRVLVRPRGSITVSHDFSVVSGAVVPEHPYAEKSKGQLGPVGTTLTLSKQFTCVYPTRPGESAVIAYVPLLSMEVTWERVMPDGTATDKGVDRVDYYILQVWSNPFQCKAALPTVLPPTPRPQTKSEGNKPPVTVTPSVPPVTAGAKPEGNRPPVVSPIQAVLESGGQTRHSVVLNDPDGDIVTALWEGRDCGPQAGRPWTGTQEGQGEFEMVWPHGASQCHLATFRTPEPHPEHAKAVIKVTISDASSLTDAHFKLYHWQITCTYTGVGTGTGPACSAPVKVGK